MTIENIRKEMEKEIVLLSFALPTYNGEKYLREALDSILVQLPDVNEKIEITISDNASTDNTSLIINEYQKHYPQIIRYYKNEKNLGPDKNYDLAVRKSKGRFVWLFSDDDCLLNGSIKKVLEIIHSHPTIVAIFINFESSTIPSSNKECLCNDGNNYFTNVFSSNTFCPSNIIRKDIWEIVKTEKYYNTNWIHIGVLIESLLHNSSIIIYKYLLKPLGTRSDPAQARWGDNGTFFNASIRISMMIYKMKDYGYDYNTSVKMLLHLRKHMLTDIPFAKFCGLKLTKPLIKDFIFIYGRFPLSWFSIIPLLFVPTFCYKIIYKIVRWIKFYCFSSSKAFRIE